MKINLFSPWYSWKNSELALNNNCTHSFLLLGGGGGRRSWPWSYGSWFYNYLCNQCLSPLMLWVRISIRARCTTICDKVCQWLMTGRWFSRGLAVSSTNKADRHDITEILLKVVLNTTKQTKKHTNNKPIIGGGGGGGGSWSWSCGSWIYNYLCNQCLSPLTLWVRTPLRRGVLDTTLCDNVCQWLATGRWFSLDTPVSSTNETDRYDITIKPSLL